MRVSIQSLPEELLVTIFNFCKDLPPAQFSHLRTTLALVSREWVAIVSNTPSLWTTIHHADAGRRNALAVQKSSTLPLDIVFSLPKDSTAYLGSPSSQQIRESFVSVCDEDVIARWRSASISFKGWGTNELLQLLERPTPLLESLTLKAVGSDSEPVFANLLGGQADRLHTIRLTRVSIPWESNILRNIQVLELHLIVDRRPSVSQFLTIIATSPRLSEVSLTGVRFLEEASSTPNETLPSTFLPFVTAPVLTRLKLHGVYRGNDLVTHIEAPSCTSFFADSIPFGRGDDAGLPPFIRHVGAFAPVAHQGEVHFAMNDYHGIFRCTLEKAPGQCFHLGLQPVNSSVVLSSMSTFPPEFRALHTKFDLRYCFALEDETTAPAFFDALARFHVVELLLGSETPLQLLGTPQTINGVQSWAFPALRNLTIEDETLDPVDVLKMVEGRYGINPSSKHGDLPLPPSLDSLVIRGPVGERDFSKEHGLVKDIVGEKCLAWQKSTPRI